MLAAGSCYDGMLQFLAMEDTGPDLTAVESLSAEQKESARAALRSMHGQHWLHQDICRENLTMRGGQVFMVDLAQSSKHFSKWKAQEEVSSLNALLRSL